MTNPTDLNRDLFTFLSESPTPFHAVRAMQKRLLDARFTELQEHSAWPELQPGRYFVSRGGSSVIAFKISEQSPAETGFRMVGAHTDSPCLQVKPQPVIKKHGYFQLGVEVYGGALLNPWFDRDLSLAGRVSYLNGQTELHDCLINFRRAIAVIPSLAIHLDREANSKRTVNRQKHLPPILMQAGELDDFHELLKAQMVSEGVDVSKVLDYQLSFYDTQTPACVGINDDFIASARLDNLLSCFLGLQALIDSNDDQNCLLVCNDHEEVGSESAEGAMGSMLALLLQRLCGSTENFARAMSQSLMISADNAHGVHPNYADKHDNNHGPLLNSGPVIKVNAGQRYATNSKTASYFRALCEANSIPVQSFVIRSDMRCGSTIGPISASQLGVQTLDLGLPTFAMHSIRELAGAKDPQYLYTALRLFNESRSLLT